MSKTLYITDPDGNIAFHTERKIGDVRIPNYVYDLWTAIIGIEGLGLYALYCRLEREGSVTGITMRRVAKLARIGPRKLYELNAMLQKYGFISIRKPVGKNRLKHFTTEITVIDPPTVVNFEKVEKDDLPPDGYEVLTKWLVGSTELTPPEALPSASGDMQVVLPEALPGAPKIESLMVLNPSELHPLDVEVTPPLAAPMKAPEKQSVPDTTPPTQAITSTSKQVSEGKKEVVPAPPKITPELKNAFALLCHGTVTAWNSPKVAKSMMGAIKEIVLLEPTVTAERITAFGPEWRKHDFRGQKGQKPEPHQVPLAWPKLMVKDSKPVAPKEPRPLYPWEEPEYLAELAAKERAKANANLHP